MKANKVIVSIKIEALSIDSIRGLVYEAIDTMSREAVGGHLRKDDGDEISWETVTIPVEF